MRKTLLVTCLGWLAVTATAAHAQEAVDKLVAAAKSESDLNFMGSGDTFGGAEGMAALEAAFNKRFGLKAKFRLTPGAGMPAVAARIAEEYKAGSKSATDVYMGSLSHFIYLTKEGVLTEVKWSETFPWITDEMEIAKNRGVLVRSGINAIVYNSEMIKPADAPRSYEDLVDPARSKAWAGRMAMPLYPDFLVELSLIWPKEKVLDLGRKLAAAATGLIRYSELQRVVNGEFAVMANEVTGFEGKAFWAAKGAKLEAVIPTNPAVAAYFQLGVPKNSASPNLATLFVAFVASPEGQAITDKYGFQGSHLVPTTSIAKYVAATKIPVLGAKEMYRFYEAGGDPQLTSQITSILKR